MVILRSFLMSFPVINGGVAKYQLFTVSQATVFVSHFTAGWDELSDPLFVLPLSFQMSESICTCSLLSQNYYLITYLRSDMHNLLFIQKWITSGERHPPLEQLGPGCMICLFPVLIDTADNTMWSNYLSIVINCDLGTVKLQDKSQSISL